MRKMTLTDFKEHEWQIIANAAAMRAKQSMLEERVLNPLRSRGITYQISHGEGAGSGMALAERLCREGHRHLMVAGGDGTVNEVVNGIYASGVDASEVYLSIIPLGTGNDFCRTIGCPPLEEGVEFLLNTSFRPTDVGVVETIVQEKVMAKRHFINIAGFAFDAAVIQETTKGKPKLFPSAVYLFKLVKVLFTYRALPVKIHTDNGDWEDEVFTIAVGNAQYNGNGMRQVPMADPHDGFLDISIIRKIRPLKVVANVKKLYSGRHLELPEAQVMRAKQVEISSRGKLLGEVEGEMLETGNYRIRIADRPLNVMSNFVDKKS